jgi:hypothetical protein
VQTEYYLQFADHYFRVIADMRAQKDEPQRPRRDNEREQSSSYYEPDDYEEAEDTSRGRQSQPRNDEADEASPDEGQRGGDRDEGETIDADDNPFTRDARDRAPRSRGRNRPANDAGVDAAADAVSEAGAADEDAGFDPGILPPSIAREEEAPRRSTRGRRRPRPDEDGEEALEAVS